MGHHRVPHVCSPRLAHNPAVLPLDPALQGVEHLHANEVILTLGMSDTTYAFLREASKKREFQVRCTWEWCVWVGGLS